jgi:hypothetical protein
LIEEEFVGTPSLSEAAVEHRVIIALLAGAVAFFAITGAAWALLLGEMLVLKVIGLVAALMLAVLIFMEPLIGLCLMAFLVPVEAVKSFAGGWLTGTKAVGIITFMAFLANARLRHGLIHFDKQSRWMFAFALWSALSFLWAKDRTSVPFIVLTVAQLTLFWVLIRASLTDAPAVAAVCISFIAGTLCGIFISAVLPRWGLGPRLMYTTGNPNHLARDIVVALIVLLYYAPRLRSWGSLVAIVAGGFLILGLVLTQSRAGWLGALCSLPLLLRGHRGTVSLVAVGLMSFLAVVLFTVGVLSAHLGVTGALLEQRWESMFHTRIVRASRVDIWRAGMKLGCRYPILGVGAGAFLHSVREVTETMPDFLGPHIEIGAHNSFLCAFAELGAVGLILLSGILWHCGRSIARQPRSPEKMVAWALLISALIQMMTMTAHYQKTIWLTLALSQVLIRKQIAAPGVGDGAIAYNDLPDD